MRKYFYHLMEKYLSLYVRPEDRLIFWSHPSDSLWDLFPNCLRWGDGIPKDESTADYIVINGRIHFERDIQAALEDLRGHCMQSTRLIITFYSALWRPLLNLATLLKWRIRTPEQNWVSPEDIENLLVLAGYEVVKDDSKILCPIYIPLVSELLNRFIAPLPFIKSMAMVHILIARPVGFSEVFSTRPSVSVIVPARNEAGNIENAVLRLPDMGPNDELIFVEGNSTDNTWEKIKEVEKKHSSTRHIVIAQQDGKREGRRGTRKDSLWRRRIS